MLNALLFPIYLSTANSQRFPTRAVELVSGKLVIVVKDTGKAEVFSLVFLLNELIKMIVGVAIVTLTLTSLDLKLQNSYREGSLRSHFI